MRFPAAVAAALLFATSAFALSPESQAELDKLEAALAKAKPAAVAVTAGLTEDHLALKEGVTAESLVSEGKALAVAVQAGAQATRKLSAADRADPKVEAFVAQLRPLIVLVEQLGTAAPDVFYSADGKSKAATADASLTKAAGFQDDGKWTDAQTHLSRAIREFNALSSEDKACPNGQAFIGKLKALEKGLKDDEAGRAARQALEKAAKQACKDFAAQFITPDNLPLMEGLVLLHFTGHSNRAQATLDDREVKEWLERTRARQTLFEQLEPVCGDAEKVKQLTLCQRPYSPDLASFYAKKDPNAWCQVVARGNELLVAELDEYVGIEGDEKHARVGGGGLERGEGWMSDDLLKKTWTTAFTVNQNAKAAGAARVKTLYAAVGVKDADTSKLTAKREEGLAALKKEVERLAPTWERPRPGVGHYGVDLAKARVTSVFKGATVVAAGGDSGQWNVHRNVLNVPEYRDRFGWVLFQVPGEPYCQLRTFYISEDYAGGGMYTKDTSPSFSRLRFQGCR